MSRWLLRNCNVIATFDDEGREIEGGDLLVDGALIEAVGRDLPPAGCDRVIDGRGLVVLPGLVNAHQHLYQGATRAIPELERALIGPWLAGLGAILQDIGDDKDALDAYRRALAVHPHLKGIADKVKSLTEKVDGRDI